MASDETREALPVPGWALPATPTALPAAPAVEGEVLAPHELLLVRVEGRLVGVRCACGRWDAVVTGPTSARWASADHRRHAAERGDDE